MLYFVSVLDLWPFYLKMKILFIILIVLNFVIVRALILELSQADRQMHPKIEGKNHNTTDVLWPQNKYGNTVI